MKSKYVSWLLTASKALGFLSALQGFPFIPPQYGITIFLGASLLKDGLRNAADLLDDGKLNKSVGND